MGRASRGTSTTFRLLKAKYSTVGTTHLACSPHYRTPVAARLVSRRLLWLTLSMVGIGRERRGW